MSSWKWIIYNHSNIGGKLIKKWMTYNLKEIYRVLHNINILEFYLQNMIYKQIINKLLFI